MPRAARSLTKLALIAVYVSAWSLVQCASPYGDSLGRWKRQSCKGFKCLSGQCIDSTQKCDGILDCEDKSDETTATCLAFAETCPAYSVRCDYGACVDSDAKCNGRQECADGSDEKGCTVAAANKCSADQFKCKDGSCIRSDFLCDGERNCKDGSDETEDQCKSISCPSFAFACNYGACIDKALICDGVKHCADGSDESKSLCDSKPTPSSTCKEPTALQGGTYSKTQNQVTYACNEGFHLIGSKVSQCQSGVWSDPPSCAECGRRSNSFGGATFVLRGEEAQYEEFPWTVAIYEEKNSDFDLICGGTLISLRTVITGLHMIKITTHKEDRTDRILPLLVKEWHGVNVQELPQQCTIHVHKENLSCVARATGCNETVALSVVNTAAHCFYDDSLSNVNQHKKYSIAAGKFYRDWDVPENGIQRLTIEKITIHFKYVGPPRHYSNDICVVTLAQEVTFSRAVRPACIDWNSAFQPKDGHSGIVSGWGYNEVEKLPEKLMKAKLIVRDFQSCLTSVPDSFIPYLTDDKFCAGHLNGTGVCRGDSGSGLLFANPSSGGWYLWGVVSIGVPKENKICSQQHYTTFVNVYEYISWIKMHYK